jgi:uncharacterized protein
MAETSYQGRFIWHELLCNDITAATFFYSQILPWKGQPYSPGSPYTMFTAQDGKPVAGAMRLSDEARAAGTGAHWRGYIGAADVDATLAQAVALGARVLQPAQDVPVVGRVALLSDPEGAVFGLYRPAPTAVYAEPGKGGYAWNELAARHRESALAFYQRLFGWELRPPMDMGGGFQYQTFGLGGQDFGGAYTIPPERAMPPSWCPYAHGASADATASRVLAAGGKIVHGPVAVPGGGRIVQFFDSQHALFAVHSMEPATAKVPAPAPGSRVKATTTTKAVRKETKMPENEPTMATAEEAPVRKPVRARRKARVVRRAKRKVVRRAKAAIRRKRALKSKLPGRRRRAARRIKRAKRRVKRKVVRVVRRAKRKLVRRRRRATRKK